MYGLRSIINLIEWLIYKASTVGKQATYLVKCSYIYGLILFVLFL